VSPTKNIQHFSAIIIFATLIMTLPIILMPYSKISSFQKDMTLQNLETKQAKQKPAFVCEGQS
jgi:hypothetical protein